MLGKLVPQPENQLEYPLKWSVPKSDLVTEGSAPQAEPKSGPFSGPRGDSSNTYTHCSYYCAVTLLYTFCLFVYVYYGFGSEVYFCLLFHPK